MKLTIFFPSESKNNEVIIYDFSTLKVYSSKKYNLSDGKNIPYSIKKEIGTFNPKN